MRMAPHPLTKIGWAEILLPDGARESSRPPASRDVICVIIPRLPLCGLTVASSEGYGMPVLGTAQEVLAQAFEEPARVGEPGTRRGVRAKYLGAVEGRLGEHVVRVAAGDRGPVPHVVIDDIPFAAAVPFPPDELLVSQDTGQYSATDKLLTGRENLMLVADLYHLGRAQAKARTEELLERFGLTEAAGKLAATYSGGMQRKLDLAMTLVSDPKIIFLDEPTTGLDPRSRRTMWQIVRDLTSSGVTIFLTTQYLEEADQLAGQIALLDYGTLIAQGTPDELKRMIPGGHIRVRFTDAGTLAKARAIIARPAKADQEALTLEVPTSGSVPELRGILARLDDHGIDAAELTVHTPDLDDVFLTLTGN
jgi:ABC-2 type transport system ATP-binding protein